MADLAPRDRQDVPIWNAIEANNFKQALKLVEKRLAKKPTDYLEALKIYIRSQSPLLTEKSAVLIQIEELTSRKPPISDVEAIELYDEALGEVLPDKQSSWAKSIGELRWQLVKAAPKDEDTVLKCFQECLSNGDLDHARQISNSLEKTFPNNHPYIFWNISTMFLFSISQSCPENQKRIWGGLALGQITKLASTTRQSTDSKKLPIRSIQTPQELLLLHRITREYGKPEQRLEYSDDSQLGPDSIIAKGEWELWRFRLKLMEEAKQWQELFDTSKSLLQRARAKDASGKITEPGMSDWIVWEAFIRSAVELPGYRQKPLVLAELEAHLDPESGIDKTWRRNASLAWVKFCFAAATPFSVIPRSDGKGQVLNHIPIVFKYLQKFGDASTAYKDLRPYVERLDIEERSQLLKLLVKAEVFMATQDEQEQKEPPLENGLSVGPLGEDLSTPNNITRAINVYKLRYLLVSALPESERSQSPLFRPGVEAIRCQYCQETCRQFCHSCIKSLALNSVKSYNTAINDDGRITKTLIVTDTHPADDFCILAAMCFIKLSMIDEDQNSEPLSTMKTSYVLQAILLLEYGWTHSKSNFQISLLLIRLYNYLGCGSLAMRAYQRLALKQVQLDTLSYTFFDRISSQHPHKINHIPEGSVAGKSLVESLQKQQKVYRNARGQVTKNMWTSFQKGNYNSVFEMKEVSDTLSRTLSGVMSVIETRKITRLTEPGTVLSSVYGGYEIIPPNSEHSSTTFTDTNDYSTFPNFESSQGTRFEVLTRFAPGPSEYRYRINLVAEKLKQVISPHPQEEGERYGLQLWLRDHVDSKAGHGSPETGRLTKPEELAKQFHDDIAVLVRQACDKERWSEEEKFQSLLDARNGSLHRALDDNVRLIEGLTNVVPAFWGTLHALYVGYDVAKTAVEFCEFVGRQEKENLWEPQRQVTKEITETAKRLLKVVVEKAASVKKGLGEGGWIDRVLEGSLPDAGEAQLTAEAVRELVDENFLEEWAGLVVESWGDSVAGLSLLKGVKT